MVRKSMEREVREGKHEMLILFCEKQRGERGRDIVNKLGGGLDVLRSFARFVRDGRRWCSSRECSG